MRRKSPRRSTFIQLIALSALALPLDIAKAATPSIGTDARAVAAGATDFISHLGAQKLRDGKNMGEFATYLHAQAMSHGMSELFVIDSSGKLLLSTKKTSAPDYKRPSTGAMRNASSGKLIVFTRAETHLTYALIRLDRLSDGYLLVARPA